AEFKRTAALVGHPAPADDDAKAAPNFDFDVKASDVSDGDLQSFLGSELWTKLQSVLKSKFAAASPPAPARDDGESSAGGGDESGPSEAPKRTFEDLSDEDKQYIFDSDTFEDFSTKLGEFTKRQRRG
ncbi:unnamed protein product, partial [Prorocentrum cordatum]